MEKESVEDEITPFEQITPAHEGEQKAEKQ